MDAQLDLPPLQGLLLGGEVVDIGVRQVVGLLEALLDEVGYDLAGQVVELLVRVTQHPTVEDMVVVPTVVESDEFLLRKVGDLVRRRVDHPLDLVRTTDLPVHEEQVGEHLDVENDRRVVRRLLELLLMIMLGGEVHLLDELDAVVGLMSRLHGERENLLTNIAHVVRHARLVGVVQDLLDEVDAGLGPGMDLLSEVPGYELADRLLALHDLLLDH